MPPRPRYTKEEITAAALALVREQGAENLTARELGKRLGSSSSPIFTVFSDMDALKAAVQQQAKACFDAYMATAEAFDPAYKKRGMQWVKFAREEPKLFRLLFMQHKAQPQGFLPSLQDSAFGMEKDIAIITRDYHASPAQAERLFRQMWIYTYGLCVLCAEQVCSFTDAEIAKQLGEIFQGMIYVLRAGSGIDTGIQPAARDSRAGEEIRKQHPDLRRGEGAICEEHYSD